MKNDGKPFLPHPIYRPLAVAFIAFLCGIVAFGVLQMGLFLGDGFEWVTVSGAVLFLIAFVVSVAYFMKFFWSVFICGGWRRQDEKKRSELI
jgi:hypothetical protein